MRGVEFNRIFFRSLTKLVEIYGNLFSQRSYEVIKLITTVKAKNPADHVKPKTDQYLYAPLYVNKGGKANMSNFDKI